MDKKWSLSFNGAATLSLRKYRFRELREPNTSMLQWGRNFIVAEIRLRSLAAAAPHTASMGPQLYRCGNVASLQDTLSDLQRFNGAATLSLRKCWIRSLDGTRWEASFNGAATLSLRKYDIAAGRSYAPTSFNGAATLSLRKFGQTANQVRNLRYASMGPQLYRCGNTDVGGCHEAMIDASMGPQLYRCGNR